MRNETVTLAQATTLMHHLESLDQPFTQLPEPLSYTGLLDRLREVGSAGATSFVFLFGAGATQAQQLKRIRRNQGPALGDLTVYAVEVGHA
ncbi:hypothetical protein [Pseudomonas marincola]|uniref:hypothetical protein n=1 Tax=Pseudomonas marincola TaxID=437900 RepID=UPI0008EC773D|nr:hypothetical protein [Pseudomonas marincola]SFT49643.1 hypothetical protein SAMN05216264_101617 [Pseudomonas marincola]